MSQQVIFIEIDKLTLKCIWKCKGSGIAKTEKKAEFRHCSYLSPRFTTVTDSETVCYWQNHRLIKQNREFNNIPLYIQSNDFLQGAMAIQWGKGILFKEQCCRSWVFMSLKIFKKHDTAHTTHKSISKSFIVPIENLNI